MKDRLPPPGVLVLALALPLIFLHRHFLPGASVGKVDANLSDLAVLAVVVAGAVEGVRLGFGPLRSGRAVWIATVLFLAAIGAFTLWGLHFDGYRFGTHAVTAFKWGEYALLAPAAALLVRARRDLEAVLAAAVAWSTVATVYGLLQFFGAADDFARGHVPGEREPSFLGSHDFAALSGMALAVAVAGIALGTTRLRWTWLAGVSGAIGLVLSGAVAGVLGLGLACLAAALVALSHKILSLWKTVLLAGVLAVVLAGTLLLRSSDVSQLVKLLGIEPGASKTTLAGSSYSQRSVLAYIGGRIFLDHPALGVGWQGSNDDYAYRPYLADARQRFPHVQDLAFPSPQHRWGVQNAYLEAAADMGVVGLAALVALLVAGLVAGARAARRTPLAAVPLLWLLMAIGIWNGLGLVAGIPLTALTWLSLGLVTVHVDD